MPPPPSSERPFDTTPRTSGPLIIHGKVVSMVEEPIEQGAVYCRNGEIVSVRRQAEPVPPGFEQAAKIITEGVIYPGLIDLHNHLAYNILPLWKPPQPYEDRYEWRKDPRYKREIYNPASKVKKTQSPAVIRYVEAKLLVGGTTAGQGMALQGGGSFQGMVRNFERTGDPGYPEIATQLDDWVKIGTDAKETMRRQIAQGQRLFHHLAEGRKGGARKGYEDTRDQGLHCPNYVGIHCTGLTGADYKKFAQTGAKAVWSPTSNLLLYGETVEIRNFLESDIVWGFGSDWSPSGTKNPLGEMKVGYLAARNAGVTLDYKLLAEAVTSRAAAVVGWEGKLGQIRAGYGADLVVMKSKVPDPYENLVRATEKDILLVTIEGVPRYGTETLMGAVGIPAVKLERCNVAGGARLIHFEHPDAPPPMNSLSLRKATDSLEAQMSDLTGTVPGNPFKAVGFADSSPELELELDLAPETEIPTADGPGWKNVLSAAPLPPLKSVELDKLTVADDPKFFTRLESVPHAPKFLAELKDFYR